MRNKIFGVVLCIIICLPYIVLGENAIITIHDFLDSTVSHIVNVINNGQFFDLSAKTPLMEGYDRFSFPFSTPFELKAFFFVFLPPYWAIVANILLVKVLAFLGMYLLLSKYIIAKNKIISFWVSAVFTLIPFYVDYGISSAGIPLITYALTNLYYNKRILTSFFLVILYAFYSTLALGGFFVCFLLFAALIILRYEDKEWSNNLFFSLIILVAFYLAANWSMIKSFFLPSDFVSHRQEWVSTSDLGDICRPLLDTLSISQYHSGAFIALPLIIGFLFIYLFYRDKYKELYKYSICLVALIVLISLGTFAKLLPFKIFTFFQFDRFYFLYPALCFVLLAKSIAILFCEKKKWVALFFFFISVVCVSVKDIELARNWLYMTNLIQLKSNALTYRAFYDKYLFDNISKDLGVKKNYQIKVVSVGLFPSIPEYNGFFCLDAYNNSYPLDYKHKFRNVISKELDKDDALKSYFDDWGSRCYVFSAELKDQGNQYLCSKEDNLSIEHLDIDTKALKDLGCQYVFSAVDIKNYKELNLDFVNAYTTPDSYWNIRVYRVI